MDELDQALLKAWGEVSAELENKPWKLARRMERVGRKELRRPVRAWCVALRASDSRIGEDDCVGGCGGMAARCCYKGYTHGVRLTGRRLAALCRPVRIGWPGVSVVEAAGLLGRDQRTVWSWMNKGVLRVERGGAVGRRGKAKHLVWSGGALDPQADDGRGPWRVWGTLWQGLYERVPMGFEQTVQRQPRLRQVKGEEADTGEAWPGRYRGWDWLCPGRVLATGEHVRCGRVCKKLWLALPAWTIGDALGDRAGAAWEAMPRYDPGQPVLACARCLGLRFEPAASDWAEAWNRFVSVVSGGLLYGREVECAGLGEAVCA